MIDTTVLLTHHFVFLSVTINAPHLTFCGLSVRNSLYNVAVVVTSTTKDAVDSVDAVDTAHTGAMFVIVVCAVHEELLIIVCICYDVF